MLFSYRATWATALRRPSHRTLGRCGQMPQTPMTGTHGMAPEKGLLSGWSGISQTSPIFGISPKMGSEPTNTGWLRYTGDMCYWDITYITNKYESDPIEQLNIWSSHRCVDSHNNQTACFFHGIWSTLLTMISVWQSIMGVSFIETLGMSEWK